MLRQIRIIIERLPSVSAIVAMIVRKNLALDSSGHWASGAVVWRPAMPRENSRPFLPIREYHSTVPDPKPHSAERSLIRALIAAVLGAAITVPAAPLIALAWLSLVKGVSVQTRLDHFWDHAPIGWWATLMAWNAAASLPFVFWGLIHYSFIGIRQREARRSMTLILGGVTLALGIIYMTWYATQTWAIMLDPGQRLHSTAVLGLSIPAFMFVAPATCIASFVGFLIDVSRPNRPRTLSSEATRGREAMRRSAFPRATDSSSEDSVLSPPGKNP